MKKHIKKRFMFELELTQEQMNELNATGGWHFN